MLIESSQITMPTRMIQLEAWSSHNHWNISSIQPTIHLQQKVSSKIEVWSWQVCLQYKRVYFSAYLISWKRQKGFNSKLEVHWIVNFPNPYSAVCQRRWQISMKLEANKILWRSMGIVQPRTTSYHDKRWNCFSWELKSHSIVKTSARLTLPQGFTKTSEH
jgi:hypothetical protein